MAQPGVTYGPTGRASQVPPDANGHTYTSSIGGTVGGGFIVGEPAAIAAGMNAVGITSAATGASLAGGTAAAGTITAGAAAAGARRPVASVQGTIAIGAGILAAGAAAAAAGGGGGGGGGAVTQQLTHNYVAPLTSISLK